MHKGHSLYITNSEVTWSCITIREKVRCRSIPAKWPKVNPSNIIIIIFLPKEDSTDWWLKVLSSPVIQIYSLLNPEEQYRSKYNLEREQKCRKWPHVLQSNYIIIETFFLYSSTLTALLFFCFCDNQSRPTIKISVTLTIKYWIVAVCVGCIIKQDFQCNNGAIYSD